MYYFQTENTYDIKIDKHKKIIATTCAILSNVLFVLNYSVVVANKAGYDISFLILKSCTYDRNFFEDIKNNHISKVEFSAKNVTNVNAKDRYGKTALHIAVDGYLFRKLTPIHTPQSIIKSIDKLISYGGIRKKRFFAFVPLIKLEIC